MISDVKPGSARAKVYHRNLAKGAVKGEFAARGKA